VRVRERRRSGRSREQGHAGAAPRRRLGSVEAGVVPSGMDNGVRATDERPQRCKRVRRRQKKMKRRRWKEDAAGD
jgi:hypothetical protein